MKFEKNIISKNGLIVSSKSPPTTLFQTGCLLTNSCKPKGSIYQQFMLNVNYLLKQGKDYPWIIHYLEEKKNISSLKNLEEESHKYAKALKAAGVVRGDVVCMLMGRNNTDVFYAAFGTWVLGGTLFFGDVRSGPQALASQMTEIGCKFVVCSDSTLSVVKDLSKFTNTNSSINVIHVQEKTGLNRFLLSQNGSEFRCIYTDDGSVESFLTPANLDVDNDIAIITFTSGTTGNPKPMVHTHSTAWNYLYGTLNDYMKSGAVTLATLKVDTSVGFIFAIFCLVEIQNTLVIEFTEEKFEENFLDAVSKYKPSSVSFYANHLVRLAETEKLQQYSLKGLLASLESILPAGAAIPMSCEKKLREHFPNLKICASLYGTSETGIIANCGTNDHIGFLQPLVEVKIISPDNPNLIVGPGEPGEICIRKPFMMKGYLNREDETRKFFDPEGFAHIGDLVTYDEEGKIHYIERIKEMIKYNDFRVWPTIVEAELQKHPAVLECMIYGKPNPPTIELVGACIVLKEGYTTEAEQDIMDFMKARMEDSNQIRGGIIFCQSLPRNSMGKLLRREARANALTQLQTAVGSIQ